ncbi:hypothetical protein V1477_011763 [Vespula maculifrons]|uniref:Uncharacterized protein n=1 Tax=Vespula maculifrons TaxID=7453 RepID=A0ABD2C0R3_VESMC
MGIEHRYTRPKPEYENRAGFFGTERRRPAQKPTPMSPSHGSHPRLCVSINRSYRGFIAEYTENKCAAIRSGILAASMISIHNKYCRPRSHRVEVAASGDPRTNGDSTLYYFYYYQESKATGRPPLPTNSSLQTLKLQPHASPHLGTDLRIAQLSNIGSFDHHLSTTDRAFATNAGTQNRIYRSHDTYASIPETPTRIC